MGRSLEITCLLLLVTLARLGSLYENFFVTLGDHFLSPKDNKEDIFVWIGYRIRDEGDVKRNHLKVTANDGKSFIVSVDHCKEYSWEGTPHQSLELLHFKKRQMEGTESSDPLLMKFYEESGETADYFKKWAHLNLKDDKSEIMKHRAHQKINRRFCFHPIKESIRTEFTYQLFNSEGESLSREFVFRSRINHLNPQTKVGFIGDDDISPYLDKVIKQVEDSGIDLLVHLGDMSYEISDFNGLKFEYYFSKLEDIISSVPMVISPGNHDSLDNYNFIKNRFEVRNSVMRDIHNYYMIINGVLLLSHDLHYINNYSDKLHRLQVAKANYSGLHLQDPQKTKEQLEKIRQESRRLDDYLTSDEFVNLKRKKLRDLEESLQDIDLDRVVAKVHFNHYPFECSFIDKGFNECVPFNNEAAAVKRVLDQHGFDFFVSGHVHGYERLKMASSVSGESQEMIIVGNGWASDMKPHMLPKYFKDPNSQKIVTGISGFSVFDFSDSGRKEYRHVSLDGVVLDKATFDFRNKQMVFSEFPSIPTVFSEFPSIPTVFVPMSDGRDIQASHKGSRDSKPSVWIVVLLIAVLVVSVIVTALCCVTRKRRRGKQDTLLKTISFDSESTSSA